MTFTEALKELGARITCGDRWAVINDNGLFVVYERTRYARKTTEIVVTADESAAVTALLNEGD